MLDIKFIRENKEKVAAAIHNKNITVDLDALLKLDEERREVLGILNEDRAEQNRVSAEIPTLSGDEKAQKIENMSALKNKIKTLEEKLAHIEEQYLILLKQVPNIPADDVPLGKSDAENVVIKTVGEKRVFDFTPKTHWEIAEQRGLIDKKRAAQVTGARFAYIKGDLVRLQLGIVQFVMNTLTNTEVIARIIADNNLEANPKAFVPVLPPLMIRTESYDAMDRLEPAEDRYKIEGEELWLQGSAEHVMGSMYGDEVFEEKDLPIRYIGYATSFRKEAGTYGKDTEGIFRMHQFDKLEMESFSTPETSLSEHLLFVAIQEYLMQQLGLPYRVLLKCTGDIGKPNARGIDIDAWLPGQDAYRETHTADYMTDYQARRLNTRVKGSDGKLEFVHTNDATGFALGRTMIAIIENYQNADGSVTIPEVLIPYCGFQTIP